LQKRIGQAKSRTRRLSPRACGTQRCVAVLGPPAAIDPRSGGHRRQARGRLHSGVRGRAQSRQADDGEDESGAIARRSAPPSQGTRTLQRDGGDEYGESAENSTRLHRHGYRRWRRRRQPFVRLGANPVAYRSVPPLDEIRAVDAPTRSVRLLDVPKGQLA